MIRPHYALRTHYNLYLCGILAVIVSVGLHILLRDWWGIGGQIWGKDCNGMGCCLVVLFHSPHTMGCWPLCCHSPRRSCTIWSGSRCGVSIHEPHPIKVVFSLIRLSNCIWHKSRSFLTCWLDCKTDLCPIM